MLGVGVHSPIFSDQCPVMIVEGHYNLGYNVVNIYVNNTSRRMSNFIPRPYEDYSSTIPNYVYDLYT